VMKLLSSNVPQCLRFCVKTSGRRRRKGGGREGGKGGGMKV